MCNIILCKIHDDMISFFTFQDGRTIYKKIDDFSIVSRHLETMFHIEILKKEYWVKYILCWSTRNIME